jgi:hypothetical protein
MGRSRSRTVGAVPATPDIMAILPSLPIITRNLSSNNVLRRTMKRIDYDRINVYFELVTLQARAGMEG